MSMPRAAASVLISLRTNKVLQNILLIDILDMFYILRSGHTYVVVHAYSWILPCSKPFRALFLSLGLSCEENSAAWTPPNSCTSTHSL